MPLLEKAFGAWPTAAPVGTHAGAGGAPAHGPAGDDRGHAVGRAVADSHRLGRRAALDARLLPAASCSTRSSAARSRRASTRTCARSTATPTAPARASTCGCRPAPFQAGAGVQTDKTSGVAARVLQGAEGHSRARSATTELAKAKNYIALGLPERVRDHQRPHRPARGDGGLQAARHLLLAVHRQRPGGDRRRRCRRRPPPTSSRRSSRWWWWATARRSSRASAR